MGPGWRIVVIGALAAACSPSRSEAAGPGTSPAHRVASPASAAPSSLATAAATAVSEANGASLIEQDDGLLEFSYRHPAAAGAIPELRASLEAERDRAVAEARRDAAQDKAEAARNDYPFQPHSLGIGWEVVTETPRFLSLSQSLSSYTGGAHGNSGSGGLVWDKAAFRRLEAADVFASRSALRAAVLAPFCAGLDRERRKKGVEPPASNDEVFPRCIDPVKDSTIILGSSDRNRIDRLGFLIDPYVAGPYVEGGYEVTLPVTPAVLAAVKPEYRDAFALRQARQR